MGVDAAFAFAVTLLDESEARGVQRLLPLFSGDWNWKHHYQTATFSQQGDADDDAGGHVGETGTLDTNRGMRLAGQAAQSPGHDRRRTFVIVGMKFHLAARQAIDQFQALRAGPGIDRNCPRYRPAAGYPAADGL